MVAIPSTPSSAPTGTGFDQLVNAVLTDPGLAGRISGIDIDTAAEAAAMMNSILVEAIDVTGAGASGIFSTDDVITINAYIRSYYLATWQELHGDDEDNEETGYHLVQNDGAYWRYRGDNLLDTVADGIYHLGFEIEGDNILNEDGNQNESLQQLAEWLTQFSIDHSTTGTGLDRITDMVMADEGLDNNISDAEIAEGADTANRMNEILDEAIQQTGANADLNISVDDIQAINQYIRDNHLDEWTLLHGNDENDEETGYHLVQNDGAVTRMFGKNFANTVADGIYHLGFEIEGDNILNEDGNQNAALTDLADWTQYFYTDQSTTGTGLDQLTDMVKTDLGLARNTSAADINEGADAANAMNALLVEAIETTGVADDANISTDDIRIINSYIRQYHLDEWIELHGNDEDGEETGYHLVQNDGANIRFRGDNLIDTVADGIYHLGFEIEGDNILNEDGNENATLGDLATWLNYFYLDSEIIYGTNDADNLYGLNHAETFYAQDGDDKVYANKGDNLIYGENGNDKLYAEDGDDTLDGGNGNDQLYAGNGNNYLVTGDGNDRLYAGSGDDTLDGGNGNDQLYASNGNNKLAGGEGNDKLYAGDGDDTLDGGNGNDQLYAGNGNNELAGGEGNDKLYAGDGDDTLDGGNGDNKLYAGNGNNYLVTGDGNDRLYAGSGDDTLDGGNGNDKLYADNGTDILLDGFGADAFYGGDGDDMLISVRDNGNDTLYGGDGADTFTFIPGEDGTSIGDDLIKDFALQQNDRIEIGGADTSIEISHIDTNGNNSVDATLVLLSNDHGDALGSITVAWNLLEADDIVLTGVIQYENALIPDGIEY